MAGLTENGFTIKTEDEIVEDLRSAARDTFADLVPPGDQVRTDDSSVIGRLIGVQVPILVDLWEAVQEVYDAFNIEAAEGIALDNLTQIGGVSRLEATSSTVDMQLSGDYLTVIPAGTQFSSEQTGNIFETAFATNLNGTAVNVIKIGVQAIQNSATYSLFYARNPDALGAGTITVTYNSDASATEDEILQGLASQLNLNHSGKFSAVVVDTELVITAVDLSLSYNFTTTNNLIINEVSKNTSTICTETGPNEQAPNTIETVVTPVLGLLAVTNPFSASPGNNRETDEELRVRYRTAKSVGATSTLEALYADLLKLDGVQDVFIFPNEAETTFNGYTVPVPPHSLYVVIEGGAAQFIGEAIFDNKAGGIGTAGNEAVVIEDSNGFNHTINFQRPEQIPIYIDITVDPEPDFAANGVDSIKAALVQYFIDRVGLGDDVLYSRLYTPINSVQGHFVTSLTVGTAPNPVGTSNIVVDDDKLATLDIANINITIV